jgi:hypothetical protein
MLVAITGLPIFPNAAHHPTASRAIEREPAAAPRAAQPGTFRLLDTALAGRGSYPLRNLTYVTALTSLGPYPE